MAKRHTRHKRHRRHRRKTMKGGAFTSQEIQELEAQGFSQYNIQSLDELNVSYNQVMQKINSIMNQSNNSYNGNSDDMVEQVMNEFLNENIFDNPEAIPHNHDDQHVLNDDDLNASFLSQDSNLDQSQGSLHLSDLEQDSRMSGYTTNPDESFGEFGGRKRKSHRNRKHSKKGRKTRKNRKQKQKGGKCYGNGVGANSYEPNYSIYNTNLLKLFPYKP